MNNIFGNQAVSGDDFFGREEIVKHLKGILTAKNSFLLLGLRRIGKSSAIKEAVRTIRAEKKQIEIIELNCQTYESIQDFYKNLHLALPKNWRDKVRDALRESKRIPKRFIDFITDHVEEIDLPYIGSVKLRNDALGYANTIKEELTAFFKKQEQHIILVIDELPFLFEHIAQQKNEATKLEIEMILSTLRSWRDIGISQAICGSLNLHIQLEHLGISRKLLGGVTTQTLPKYTKEESTGLLKALAKTDGLPLEDAHIDEMLHLIPDRIPQFLQYFYFSLKTHGNSKLDNVKAIYENYVYPEIVKDFEYQFSDRFAKLPKQDTAVVIAMLNKILSNPNISESTLLKSVKGKDTYAVLLTLTNQEFIVVDEHQCYNFSFNIIRNWWQKKNIK
jgi:DNA polymerase III delta prime subunit